MLPASETPVNQKIYHLNTLHLYPAQTRKRIKKELRILTLNFRHPVIRFLHKTMGLVQIKVTTSNHDFGLDYKLHEPNYTDHPQVNVHCIVNFFTVHDFE